MYGKILKVDLTTEKVDSEPVPDNAIRKYLGGQGINNYLLWEHFLRNDIKADPLGPDNILILGVGPLGGTGYGAGTKMRWTFKSPQTNAFGDGMCGGFLGANLRWTGHDHLVITGKAKRPVYLLVKDNGIEIKDASKLWGKDTYETNRIIREKTGEEQIGMGYIGPAAENLVRYTSIISDGRSGAKMGAGCVMGSKNLKAIAACGKKGVKIHDPVAFIEACDALAANLNKGPREAANWMKYGTRTLTAYYNDMGYSSVRNNQFCVYPEEKMAKLHHQWYEENFKVKELACSPGCVLGCGAICEIRPDQGPAAAKHPGFYGTPEYVGLAGLGLMCDVPDFPACTYLWDLCNRYSLDAMETSVCIAFLMELWQRGIITPQDTLEWMGEPLSLEWGNYEAMGKIIHSVAHQSNKMGKILQHGIYETAMRISELKKEPVLKYAIYGKFGVGEPEEVRSRISMITQFAISSRGCDHLKAASTPEQRRSTQLSTEWFGTPAAAELFTIPFKGAATAIAEYRHAVLNDLGVCMFVVGRGIPMSLEALADALAAVTGKRMTAAELYAAGERTTNLEKAFNSRLGYRREDDKLCERWMKEPAPEGSGKGWKAEDFIEQTVDEYYRYHGWDPKTSLQTRKKLEELNMKDVADLLEREGALA